MGATEWALVVMAGIVVMLSSMVCLLAWSLLCTNAKMATHIGRSQHMAQSQAMMFSSNELQRLAVEVDAIRAAHQADTAGTKPAREPYTAPVEPTVIVDESRWKAAGDTGGSV